MIQKNYNTKKLKNDKVLRKNKIYQNKNIFLLSNKKHRKLKKKWRFWRGFKQYFINNRKLTFFKKLQWNFNERRLIWHQLSQIYLPKIKNKFSKRQDTKFFFVLNNLEFRLPVILLRSRFYTKINNCYESIKKRLICINGVIIKDKSYLLQKLDLYQKRRHINNHFNKNKNKKYLNRIKRLKWRRFRWKKARFIFWKIRRQSNFNLYLNKRINNYFNFLEINYKIPAGIVIKKPFVNEIIINKQKSLLSYQILKKIYFLY